MHPELRGRNETLSHNIQSDLLINSLEERPTAAQPQRCFLCFCASTFLKEDMVFLSSGEKWGHDRVLYNPGWPQSLRTGITGTKSPHAGLKYLKILLAFYGGTSH